jgi:hypothetical protein
MTISRHTHVGEVAMFQIFSCFASNAIEASPIVVYAKFIIDDLVIIAVKKMCRKSLQPLQGNVLEQQRKVLDAKTRQPIQMVDVIYIK